MRQSSRTARRLTTGTLALLAGAGALLGTRTVFFPSELAPAPVGAANGVVVATDRGATAESSNLIAAAVGRVVRTGATTETATVLGGAAATGASAAALPDTAGSGTILAMAGVFLLLCAAAAAALVRASRREGTH